MAVDGDVVRRVGEDHLRALIARISLTRTGWTIARPVLAPATPKEAGSDARLRQTVLQGLYTTSRYREHEPDRRAETNSCLIHELPVYSTDAWATTVS